MSNHEPWSQTNPNSGIVTTSSITLCFLRHAICSMRSAHGTGVRDNKMEVMRPLHQRPLIRVISDRLAWVDKMLLEIRSLPLSTFDNFIQDNRNIWSAESCLRRSLEALLDMGRHILAKAYGLGVTEYKEIARELGKNGVLDSKCADIMEILAGYRNRMVHFYQEISTEELYKICNEDLDDINQVRKALADWVEGHQNLVDNTL